MAATRATANTEEIVKASETRLKEFIRGINQELKTSISDVKDELTGMKEKLNSVEHDVVVHGNDLLSIRKDMADMKHAFSLLERQCVLKDIHDRKPNLHFYGLPQTPKEDTEKVLKTLFKYKLNFDEERVEDMLLKTAHRLPKSEYQRSIIATFIKMSDRDDIFDARKTLRGTGISIQTDLPAMMKKRRAILSRKANEIRADVNLWTRVRVVGTEVVLEVKEPHNPASPWKPYTNE